MAISKTGSIIPNTTGAYAWRVREISPYENELVGEHYAALTATKFNYLAVNGRISVVVEPIVAWRVRVESDSEGFLEDTIIEPLFYGEEDKQRLELDFIVEPSSGSYTASSDYVPETVYSLDDAKRLALLIIQRNQRGRVEIDKKFKALTEAK